MKALNKRYLIGLISVVLFLTACPGPEEVKPANKIPVAQDQAVNVKAGEVVVITLVATDEDTDDTLAYGIVTVPTKGGGVLNGNKVTYTANADASGEDSFTFKANDGTADSNTAKVTINITAVVVEPGDSASATDDSYDAIVNTSLEVASTASGNAATTNAVKLLDNDGEEAGTSAPATTTAVAETKATTEGGTVTIAADGGFIYTPAAGFTGADTFTYTIADATVAPTKTEATVTVTVAAVGTSAKVWYVKGGATAGTGTAAAPFGSLTEAATASAAGDTIVLLAGELTAAAGENAVVLKDDQTLLGQKAALSLNGTEVLAASTTASQITADALTAATVVLANNTTVKGLTIARAANADIAEDLSAIAGSDLLTGTLTLEDLVITEPSGHGIFLDDQDLCPVANAECTERKSATAPTDTVARFDISITNVVISSPANTAIYIWDADETTLDTVTVTTPFAGAAGGTGNDRVIQISSEHIATVSVINSSVTTTRRNAKAFYFWSNDAFGRTTAAAAVMTVTLADNDANFTLVPGATGNDQLMGDPPVAGSDGKVDGTVAYQAATFGAGSSIVFTAGSASDACNADSGTDASPLPVITNPANQATCPVP